MYIPSDLSVMLTSASSGILVHLFYFMRGEHHLHPLSPAKTYGLALLFAVVYRTGSGHEQLSIHILGAVKILVFHFLGLFSSIVIYRLFFHRLCGFPGPVLARMSMLWYMVQNIPDRKAYTMLLGLEKKYGKFVRIGPNKLVIFDGSVLDAMENPNNGCRKADWYDVGYPTTGINMWRDVKSHNVRRKVWDLSFSQQSLAHYDTVIKLYSNKLARIVSQKEGIPMNWTSYARLWAFDVIGEIGFSRAFGSLEAGRELREQHLLSSFMGVLGAMSAVPWLCRIATDVPDVISPWTGFLSWCERLTRERIELRIDTPDILSRLIAHSREMGTLPRDVNLLRGDVQTLLAAGTDTTAATLVFVLYHLCLEPEHQFKIRAELKRSTGTFDAKTLQQCKYLDWVIEETMRLNVAIPTLGERLTGPEGLMIGNTFIPPGAIILPFRHGLGRLESCFENAQAFIPERWSPDTKLHHEGRAHLPFGTGRYGCVGRQLALMEIRCVVAVLLNQFSVRFADEQTKHRAVEDMRDHVTAMPGRLDVVFDRLVD